MRKILKAILHSLYFKENIWTLPPVIGADVSDTVPQAFFNIWGENKCILFLAIVIAAARLIYCLTQILLLVCVFLEAGQVAKEGHNFKYNPIYSTGT